MLLLGKQFTKNNPNKVGGVITLFELFKNELSNRNIPYQVIDLNWRNYRYIFFAYPVILLKIFFQIPKHKYISFHGTANEYTFIAPIAVFWGKLWGKKISLRKFAGNFIEIYENSNIIYKKLINYTLSHSDINFFETKYLVNYFKHLNKKTYWFPNVREKTCCIRDILKPYEKKFIFLGHIVEEKGIVNLLNAAKELDSNYYIDLYGPIISKKFSHSFLSSFSNVSYKGVLAISNVNKTLSDYDVLILPSFREGYPGVIIEALSVGLPVIASNLRSISEMLDESCSILINPKSTNELVKAIRTFNKKNYPEFSKNALKRFSLFDSDTVTKRVIKLIQKI